MIATIEGIVSEKGIDTVVIEAGGLGYEVSVTNEDYGKLDKSKSAKLFIYEHIRENSHDLYGFINKSTKQLFEQLLSVNGVGPKVAIVILSLGNSAAVANAIANQDVEFVKQASGVGKRVAERVVVELKDKVGVVSGESVNLTTAISDEAVQGLMALGFSQADAAKALSRVDSKLNTEARIKQALKDNK